MHHHPAPFVTVLLERHHRHATPDERLVIPTSPLKVVSRICPILPDHIVFRGKLASASSKYRSRETRPYIIEEAFNGDEMLVEVSFTPLPLPLPPSPPPRLWEQVFSVKKDLQKSSFLGMVRHGVTMDSIWTCLAKGLMSF